jgi:hypothetical protein
MSQFNDLFERENNSTREDRPDLIREEYHVRRDLECVPASGSSPHDNYSKLAPAFGYTGKIPLTLMFDGQEYGIATALATSHRASLAIRGPGGRAVATAANAHVVTIPPDLATYPNAPPIGGPAGGLVALTAGMTMLHIYGSNWLIDGVNFKGRYQESNSANLQDFNNYKLCAATGLHLHANLSGDESDLDTEPYYAGPGVGHVANCSFVSMSCGVKAGNADWDGTVGGGAGGLNSAYYFNHGDHTLFSHVNFSLVEDAFIVSGVQSLHFTFLQPYMVIVKRFLRLMAGGSVTLITPRLQCMAGGTLIHVVSAERNTGHVEVINCDVDGTLVRQGAGPYTPGFYYVNHGAIPSYTEGAGSTLGPVGSSAWHPANVQSDGTTSSGWPNSGARTRFSVGFLGGRCEVASGDHQGPNVRIKGSSRVDFERYQNLPAGLLELEEISTARPGAHFERCVFEAAMITDLEDLVHSDSAGNKYWATSTGCRNELGTKLTDIDIDET